MTSYQGFTYTFKSIKIIHDELSSKNHTFDVQSKKNQESLDFKKYLKIENMDFKYPTNNKEIFKNLNFDIKKNSIVGIVAKSGGGKSTLANILMGFLKPTKGEIKIDGKHQLKSSTGKLKNYVSKY